MTKPIQPDTSNTSNVSNGTQYTIQETPLGTARAIRVIAIGAGASGLNLAHKISKHMHNIDLTLYEKNPEVGGTWYENRYPGCACDIPSHNYQFTWEPNPDWSALYGLFCCLGLNEVATLTVCVAIHRLRRYWSISAVWRASTICIGMSS